MVDLSKELLEVVNSRNDMDYAKSIVVVVGEIQGYIQIKEVELLNYKNTLENGTLSQQVQWDIHKLVKKIQGQIADLYIIMNDYISIILEDVLSKSGIL